MPTNRKIIPFEPRVLSPESIWMIPVGYIIAALLLGWFLPQLDQALLRQQVYFSPGTATSLLSAISSGMIAFTGFVFSMLFVFVQFSSSAYSPRVARYFLLDPLLGHALGIFVATFIYSLLALSQVEFASTNKVPDFTVAFAMLMVLASTVMFLLLIRRTSTMQINGVLDMLGARGEQVILSLYPLLPAGEPPSDNGSIPLPAAGVDPRQSPVLAEIYYHGRPRRVVAYDLNRLEDLAEKSGTVIEIKHEVGDMVSDHYLIAVVYGSSKKQPDENAVLNAIKVGPLRTIEQDPKYSIRLIVDIAIRALSPAVNDPTTAVQALDQLQDLLKRIGGRDLDVGYLYDTKGNLRVLYPTPDWDDFLILAISEILYFGGASPQVTRRLVALLNDLKATVPENRKAAVQYQMERVEAAILRSFPDAEAQRFAREPDRQGISLVK